MFRYSRNGEEKENTWYYQDTLNQRRDPMNIHWYLIIPEEDGGLDAIEEQHSSRRAKIPSQTDQRDAWLLCRNHRTVQLTSLFEVDLYSTKSLAKKSKNSHTFYLFLL